MLNQQTIILLLYQPWQWSTNYPNEFVRLLSKNNTVIVYDGFQERKLWKFWQWWNFPEPDRHYQFFHPIFFLPFRRLKLIQKLNRWLNELRFKIFLRLHQTNNSFIYWFFNPDAAIEAKKLLSFSNQMLVYDCVDYFSTKKNNVVLSMNPLVFCHSSAMKKYLSRCCSSHNEKISILPAGFDRNSFHHKKKNLLSSASTSPIIGYSGGINSRLDAQLLVNLAAKNPHWQFQFWGPWQFDHFSNTYHTIKRIMKLPNVSFHSCQRQELSQIIAQFSVAIIPYQQNSLFTKYSFPTKFFEYLFCGIPIVSAPILSLQDTKFHPYITFAKTYQEWQQRIDLFLQHPWPIQKKEQAQQLSIYYSWENILAKKSKIVDQYIKKRSL